MMMHLVMHLVPQIMALGPLYLHELWTYQCFMSTTNGYGSNYDHPKGSKIEANTNTKEATETRSPFSNKCIKD